MAIAGGEKVSPMQAQWGGLHKYVGPMPTRPTSLWEVGFIERAYKKICGGWVGVYLGKVSPMPGLCTLFPTDLWIPRVSEKEGV